MSCQVCCECFNQKTRVKVSCNYCEYAACRTCVQRYLTSVVSDPHCMQCKNAWNREFVDQACTKTFRNGTLKEHREQVLFEREKCLLPEAQVVVAQRKELAKRRDKIEEHRIDIAKMKNEIDRLEIEMYHIRVNHGKESKRDFVRKCPADECRGFLSTRWKCDVCENYICAECNEIKVADAEHTCDPNAVETIKLLKKDTKPCVNCGTMIFKISGCAQMWCPSCHTAFDWNTGRIETGLVHNPHFYDFQRQNGRLARNPGDVPCGGLPRIEEINAIFKTFGRFVRPTNPMGLMFYNIHRLAIHIEHVELVNQREYNTMELRVEYLINKISEDVFKKKLQQFEKKREKKRDIRNILIMFSHTCGDILRQLVQEPGKAGELADILRQLRTYTNDTFQNIQKRYGNATPMISEGWDLV